MGLVILTKAIGYWRGLATGSVNRRIFSAMVVITAATAVVKIAAVAKDVLVARAFGLGDELDAFLIALVVPSFLAGVVAYSFNGAFMPAYIRLTEHRGVEAGQRIFANIIVINFAVLAACALLVALVGRYLLGVVAPEFSEQKLELTYRLYLILLPMLLLQGQAILWGSVLNAGEKFALVAFAPILTPLAAIVALLAAVPNVGVTALAWAAVIGCAAELLIIGMVLARRGLLPFPAWHPAMPETGAVLRQYVPLVLSSIIMSSAPVINQAMASWLGPGSVSALNFGGKIPSFLGEIGISALGAAVLPHFARLAAQGDRESVRHTLRTYARWIIIVSIPLTVVFIAGSHTLVYLLFERGAFRPEDTALVARIQQMYLLQTPFLILALLGVRLLVAMGKNHLLTIMSVINLAVNVGANLIFMRWLGVPGIALSTTLVHAVSMTMILFLVMRLLARPWSAGVR